MKLFADFFTSRKAQALLVVVVITLFGGVLNIDEAQITLIVEAGIAYILGRAIHDHAIKK